MRRVRRLTTSGLATLGVRAGGRGRTDKYFLRRDRRRKYFLSALPVGLLIALFMAAPALAVAPEVPELTVEDTTAAVGTPSIEARLHGVLNPKALGEAGTYQFFYKASKTGACEGGGVTPVSPGMSSGSEHEEYYETISGLTPGTEYAVCLRVESTATKEATVTPAVSFTTSVKPEKPETLTPAKSITATTVTLEGVLNPKKAGEAGTYEFLFRISPGECEGERSSPVEPAVGHLGEKVTANVSELQPNATYTFCLLAHNAAGEATVGNPVPFTTKPAPPKVDSESVSAVTPAKATLEAQVNPNNEKTAYFFEYSTSEAEVLAGKGAVVSGAPPAAELEGGSDQTASVATTPVLAPGTVYFYRVVAKNTTGTQDGSVQSFTTVPSAVTEAATEVTATGATFNGTLGPLSATDTTYSFDYRLGGGECTGQSATNPEDAGMGAGAKTVFTKTGEQALELQPNAAYSVCLLASNAFGSQVGQPVGFKTLPGPPKIDSESSGVTPSGMVLQAQINPDNQETSYTFEYSSEQTLVSEGKGTKIANGVPLKPVFGDQTAQASTESGLAPGTTYYYRVTAENYNLVVPGEPRYGREDVKTEEGKVEEFTTPPAPLASTGEAQGVTRTTATLSGEVNPEGAETTYYFVYIGEAGYQEALKNGAANPASPHYQEELAKGAASPYAAGETTAPAGAGASTEPQAVGPLPISGLQPGQTYHYALIAKSFIGLTIGKDATLTTPPGTPPLVSTGAVSGVSQSSATLSGTITTNGLQTNYGFEISAEPFQPGTHVPATGLGAIGGAASEEVAVTLGELQPGTTYYYRVTANNADGTSYGEPETFATSGFPTLLTTPAAPLQVATPNVVFPKEEKGSTGTGTVTKKLTNKQKLAKALKQCHAKKAKGKRVSCERQARKKYGAVRKRTKA
jgi:FlaG/FlaF family flagellin (archaellin)